MFLELYTQVDSNFDILCPLCSMAALENNDYSPLALDFLE